VGGYITGGEANFHGALPMAEDLELRETDVVAYADAGQTLVPLVADVSHGVADWKMKK
jgi:hypothetical protein